MFQSISRDWQEPVKKSHLRIFAQRGKTKIELDGKDISNMCVSATVRFDGPDFAVATLEMIADETVIQADAVVDSREKRNHEFDIINDLIEAGEGRDSQRDYRDSDGNG